MMRHTVEVGELTKTGRKRPVIIDGKEYNSVSSAYREFQICESSVYRYRKMGMSYADAIATAIERKEEYDQKREQTREKWMAKRDVYWERAKAREVSYNGVTYRSLKDACEALSEDNDFILNPSTIKQKAKREGISVSLALAKDITKKKKKVYKRRKDLKKRYGKLSYNLTGKEIHRLMDWYVKKGGFICVLSNGFPEYLAKELNITRDMVLNEIEWYIRCNRSSDKEFTKFLKDNADYGLEYVKKRWGHED